MVSIHGGLAITIFEPLGGRGIRCVCSPELFAQLQGKLGKRVLLFGEIKFNRRGRPLEIKVESWRRLRDRSDLPQAVDLRGLTAERPIDTDELSRTLRE